MFKFFHVHEGRIVMKKFITIVFLTILGFSGAVSFAQDASQRREVKTASGQVAAVDWVGAKLVIDTGGDQVTFVVSGDVKVTKGTDEISFSEINVNDEVAVDYYDAGFVGLKVVRINVKTSESGQ
jgi:hypothetical protein